MRPITWMRLVRDSNLPGPVKLTAFVIALRADLQGQCRPSYQRVADDCGADRRDIIRRIRHLRESGWLMVANRANGHGSQSNSYLLITPTGGDTRPTPLVTPDPPPSDTRPTPWGVTPDPPRSEGVIEVGGSKSTSPVDNPHLAAVIELMGRNHRMPQ